MDLYTRCPKCDTVFRVSTRHLQASGGQVRCGKCQAVFDAYASLMAKPPAVAGSKGQQAVVSDVLPVTSTVEAGVAEDASAQSVEPTQRRTDSRSSRAGTEQGEATPAPVTPEKRAHDPASSLYEWEFKNAPINARFGMWLTLSVVMLLIAMAQSAYVFRTALLVNVPQVRPVYEYACRWLSCEVGLPRLTDQLHIDASDLQFIDPEKPNLVQLTALVRNRARVAIEYPALELTLTSARDQVIARRVFLPEEYLTDPAAAADGLSGMGGIAVNLFLDTGSLKASGYRIYLFYPG